MAPEFSASATPNRPAQRLAELRFKAVRVLSIKSQRPTSLSTKHAGIGHGIKGQAEQPERQEPGQPQGQYLKRQFTILPAD